VGDDVPTDSDTPEVNLYISIPVGSIFWTQSFEGAHKCSVCVRKFIEVSMYVFMNVCVGTVFYKKKKRSQILTQAYSSIVDVNHTCVLVHLDASK
jgi:hypothetical protein